MKENLKRSSVYGIGLVIIAVIIMLSNVSEKIDKNNSQETELYSASVFSSEENSFDFKTISMKDGEVAHDFQIENTGTEPITIKKIYTSCMCTNAFIIDGDGNTYGGFGMPGHSGSGTANIQINAGDNAIVRAVFDPNAHGPSGVGLAARSIYVETNSSRLPKLELSFRAMVTR
ncbi:MAG: DUF1573 domain-containing protein [Parcubacteria group bacterium]|nr:DUF1573 domain-containing protein [Parcubacteria group bacterium]